MVASDGNDVGGNGGGNDNDGGSDDEDDTIDPSFMQKLFHFSSSSLSQVTLGIMSA